MASIPAEKLVGAQPRQENARRGGGDGRGWGVEGVQQPFAASSKVEGKGYGQIHLGIVGVHERYDLSPVRHCLRVRDVDLHRISTPALGQRQTMLTAMKLQARPGQTVWSSEKDFLPVILSGQAS